jgi:hypothetical protein
VERFHGIRRIKITKDRKRGVQHQQTAAAAATTATATTTTTTTTTKV